MTDTALNMREYGRIRGSENSYSHIFNAVINFCKNSKRLKPVYNFCKNSITDVQ